MHLTKWKIKKDLNFLISSFFFFFFLHSTHSRMESAVDEVRSFRCTVGSGQDARWAVTTGSMPCFDREYYKATILTSSFPKSWAASPQTSSNTSRAALSCQHHDPLPARRLRTMLTQKVISKWYASTTFRKKKKKKKKGFQKEMHDCNVLWVDSLLECGWIQAEDFPQEDHDTIQTLRLDPSPHRDPHIQHGASAKSKIQTEEPRLWQLCPRNTTSGRNVSFLDA